MSVKNNDCFVARVSKNDKEDSVFSAKMIIKKIKCVKLILLTFYLR